MSFLSGAADCGPVNPLAQVSKHAQADRSLQRDRFQAQGPRQQGMRGTAPMAMSSDDQEMMQNFYNGETRGPEPFNFSGMRHELDGLRSGSPRAGVSRSKPENDWAKEFDGGSVAPMSQHQQHQQQQQQQHQPQWRGEFLNAPPAQGHMADYHPPTQSFMPQYSTGFSHPYFPSQDTFSQSPAFMEQQDIQSKGKQRLVQLDDTHWESQFAEIERAALQEQEEESKLDDEANKAIEEELNTHDEAFYGDFESIWNGINAERAANNDFTSDMDAYNEQFLDQSDSGLLNSNGKPDLGEYTFEPNNPYMDLENPLELGKSHIARSGSGNLTEAALAFEAAVQRDPDNAESWVHLGQTQAQNEKEVAAIRALEQAIKLDPGNLSALMSLAVSYTNEGYDTPAYLTLSDWLSHRYPEHHQRTEYAGQSRKEIHEKVTGEFIRAAQRAPSGDIMDADVQVGLGVLFYGDEEYEKAVDCFEAALRGRPDDPLMWNRLGATLANSGRSEEAISSYHKALDLNPTFVRARYNLGVSCINIGCYEEAAQHLLGALSMHDEKGVNVSVNLWETLGRVLLCLDRRDLLEHVEKRNVGAVLKGLNIEGEV